MRVLISVRGIEQKSCFLMEQYGKKGVSVDMLVQAQIDKAARDGRTIDYDTAYEEVIADSCESLLSDGDVIKKLAELKARDEGLFEKIKSFITNLVARIKKAYAGFDPDSYEGKIVSEMIDEAERLKGLFVDALIDASEARASGAKVESEISDVRYDDRNKSVVHYENAIDQIDNGTLDIQQNTHLKVLEHTPQIYIDKAGASNCEIVMSWDVAYLAMKKSGEIPGNYHGLGADVMKSIPHALEDPLFIVKQKNGRIAAVTKIVVKGKRAVFASIELDAFKTTTQKGKTEAKKYNLLVTVTDAKPNYLQNTIFNGEIVHNKNNEDPAHFILRLKSLEKAVPTYDLAESSDSSISQSAKKSNTFDEKNSGIKFSDRDPIDIEQYKKVNRQLEKENAEVIEDVIDIEADETAKPINRYDRQFL